MTNNYTIKGISLNNCILTLTHILFSSVNLCSDKLREQTHNKFIKLFGVMLLPFLLPVFGLVLSIPDLSFQDLGSL